MQEELKDIQRRVGATFVHVTHDQEEAMAIADLIVVMNDGRIEDAGPPERVYRAPRSRFAATFLGDMALLPGVVRAGQVETALGPLGDAGDVAEGTAAAAGIRPEHLSLDGSQALAEVDVVESHFLGGHRKLRCAPVAAPEITLAVHRPVTVEARVGDRLTLRVDPDTVVVLTR
ncbi:MAG: TOBE domain-containing protein [Pseudomonadota bacterium]